MIELPRITKELSRSKSISTVEVLSLPTGIGLVSTILIPLRAALGNVIDGELEPVRITPFFNVMPDCDGSMISRKPQ